jgi:hypothetical protein
MDDFVPDKNNKHQRSCLHGQRVDESPKVRNMPQLPAAGFGRRED